MDNNFRLEKEYKIQFDVFRDAYTAFQKKNVYPKSYLYMGLFLAIAVIYIIAAVKDPSNTLAYILICISLALAAREWFNPRKIRRNLMETIQSENLMDSVYKLCVADEFIEISTVSAPTISEENLDSQDSAEQAGISADIETDAENDAPKPSRIPINDDLNISEFDEFFLLHVRKKMFYVVPKADFDETEQEIIRTLKS